MDWGLLTSFINRAHVDPAQIHQEHRIRTIRSKYDYLSVRVKIDQYEYVFSRFNLSRYLTACMLPPSKAVDISRRIKEEYVDSGRFEVTQEELTSRVFQLISDVDSSAATQRRFRLIQSFNLERIPLIIFLSGTGFLGKSNLAFQLGERLNISTILQTDIVCALTSQSGDHLGRQLWYTRHNSLDDFMRVYDELSEIATNGIEGDIVKTLVDGKPLIVEGIHLDPDRYLKICGQNSLNPLPGFHPANFGRESKGKQGFILPILLIRPNIEVQTAVRSTIFGSVEKRGLKLDIPGIANYAVGLQDVLVRKFPAELTFNLGEPDALTHIHRLFLERLEAYYAAQQR
jgi:hypothetical protein